MDSFFPYQYKKERMRRKKYKCLSTGKIVDECVTGLLKEEWIRK